MSGLFRKSAPVWVVSASGVSLLLGSVVPASAASTPDDFPNLPSSRITAAESNNLGGGDRFIVKFDDAAKASSADRRRSYDVVDDAVGASVEELRRTANGSRVMRTDRELTAAEADELMKALAAQPDVEYAERDILMYPAFSPNDTYYDKQWAFSNGNAGLALPEAWRTTTGKGSVVAVIDTGMTRHSDLEANVLPGGDLISNPAISDDGDGRDQDPLDYGDWCDSDPSSWHGTHVAGIIAAVAGNGRGVAGAAHGAKVVPVRVLGACGGYESDIADGVIWAA
ncbi:S8 family serine peptidase, partial [Arthrobacter sp.]|uniref:S8 family serine peptidase n=1 Tax=Arthrobacter sp. TaxID=1667 RepID=UPI003399D90B